MSQNNDSVNYASDTAQKEHKDEENPRFGRGRRGNQEENGQNQDHSNDRKNDHSKGPNKDSNKSGSGPEKNNHNNQENSEILPENPAPPKDQNQDQTPKPDENADQNQGPTPKPNENDNQNQDNTPKPDENDGKNNEPEESGRGGKDNEFDGRGRDDKSDDGRGRDDRSDGGHWRDDKSDGRSERDEFDEQEEECERPEPEPEPEPEEGEEECEPHKPELDEQGNPRPPNGPHHDFSDDGRDHSDHGPGRLPPGGPESEAPSYRPGFMERTSAYTLTFSSETMFEVVLGSLLILVSAVFLFIYMVKRQRRKTMMRSQSPTQNLQFVTPNQNIATSNFYQYYQKEGVIPTGTVVGYISEGQFLQSGAKDVQNLKSFGRLPTQDEILDLS